MATSPDRIFLARFRRRRRPPDIVRASAPVPAVPRPPAQPLCSAAIPLGGAAPRCV